VTGSTKVMQGMKQSKIFKSFQDPQIEIVKKISAATLISKIIRGYLGRIRVKKIRMITIMKKKKNMKAVQVVQKCILQYLERKNLLILEIRAIEVGLATNIIQSFFRKFLHLKKNIMVGITLTEQRRRLENLLAGQTLYERSLEHQHLGMIIFMFIYD
jgi:hypothetical protein